MAVTAFGSTVGKALTERSKKETIELAMNGRLIADISREEANALIGDPKFSARLIAADKKISSEFWWFVGANFAIQILLILFICLACGKLVISTVTKHVRS
jgi:hypothetical protein